MVVVCRSASSVRSGRAGEQRRTWKDRRGFIAMRSSTRLIGIRVYFHFFALVLSSSNAELGVNVPSYTLEGGGLWDEEVLLRGGAVYHLGL